MYKKSPDYKVTFYEQKDPPKKADLSKQFFGKKRIAGARRRRSKPVSPPCKDEAEAEFSRVLNRPFLTLNFEHPELGQIIKLDHVW